MPSELPADTPASVVEMLAGDAVFQTNGFVLVHAEAGRATVRTTVQHHMTNSHGLCHGGYLFLLADEAFAIAGNAARHPTVAASASIDFLQPVQEGQVIEATATETTWVGRRGVFDVIVRADGEVVAAFRGISAHMRA